jgi:hypothetical protein
LVGTAIPLKTLRAAGVRALELTALSAFDPSSEPQPDIDRWLNLNALAFHAPAARQLSTFGAAFKLGTLLTRVDPSASWDAPEVWTVKDAYKYVLASFVARAVAERMGRDAVAEMIDAHDNPNPTAPTAPVKSDPVKAGRQAATRVLNGIAERKIDGQSFLDDFISGLAKRGQMIAPAPLPKTGWIIVKSPVAAAPAKSSRSKSAK